MLTRVFRRVMSSSTTPAACARFEVREGGIAVVTLDAAGEKVNLLGARMMADLEPILLGLEKQAAVRGIVIISAKPDNFIAGADIGMLEAAGSSAALTTLSSGGQVMMDRLATMAKRKPVVAAINGTCLGGGLELALACSYRVASSGSKTRLGLPEVKLGLLPGAGGTQRLPRLIGIQESIMLMTTGSAIKPEKALKLGLVNAVVEPAALEASAIHAAREIVEGRLKAAAPKPLSIFQWLLEGNPIGRHFLFDGARKAADKVTGGKYPAVPAILDVVRKGTNDGFASGLKAEATAFGELGMTNESKSLRGIFFSDTACKRAAAAIGKAAPFGTIAVIGAGLMGAGIAQVSAVAGLRVVLKDREAAAVARGEQQISASLAERVKRRRMTAFERSLYESSILGVSDADASAPAHLARCDAVVEAVFENIDVKHKVIQQLEAVVRPDALIATNTSAIPISKIAEGAKHPERILGIHYFSPVDKMPLAEIIPHAGTSPAAIALAVAIAQKQGKTVIVVKDVPGFYVNRCLGPYMAEGMALVAGGVDPATLDSALKSFGFPVGPVSLMDEVGLDVAYHTFNTLRDALGNRMTGGNPDAMKEMVERKMLGRKTGRGFFMYPDETGKRKSRGPRALNPDALEVISRFRAPGTAPSTMSEDEMQQRMLLRFVKECILCAEDGILAPGNPQNAIASGDIGAVFGIGFPPFLGGPFRYCDARGLQNVADAMQRLADTVGPQFSPPRLLLDLAKEGKKFHS